METVTFSPVLYRVLSLVKEIVVFATGVSEDGGGGAKAGRRGWEADKVEIAQITSRAIITPKHMKIFLLVRNLSISYSLDFLNYQSQEPEL